MVTEVKDVFQEDERKQGGDQYVTSHEQNASVEQDFRQSPIAKLEDLLGQENYQRLKELKGKYDRGNVFSRWLKIEA
ncbi:hypothetical protein VKT23_000007 [Stygiomarasmius scandens]|uniref:Berberine/berberine-like domain-containing protein n=1 Tax=Marasmiellus scandens TaxID=2682957 RepID=A0ABR1K4S5_9AGAR